MNETGPDAVGELAARLGNEQFVSLTTFRRNGDGVASAMWVVTDGDRLAVWTPADSWKVKRARRDGRVTLRACSRTGKVADGEPELGGTAEVITEPGEVARIRSLVRQKYGLGFHVITGLEAILARGRKTRAVLRISPQSTKAS